MYIYIFSLDLPIVLYVISVAIKVAIKKCAIIR